MGYAALVQHLIYSAGPCYQYPLTCDGGNQPNMIHVGLQTPEYALIAISEIFASVTGLQYSTCLQTRSVQPSE
jgi:POT family proton-dependent oligopeptide transporter